ncbi:McrC family protein [Emcibacteraceae bacterium]|jgi:5-methylcytosine-specific restriction enzyme subunit McrC|nr:McrC family protein [Emcibacteraceae bacterium]MDA9554318.1 McrC family protein [Emcibacteraceae bacterium]MDA9771607.1 McrC family protein [Emcibacteraceae bacterium]
MDTKWKLLDQNAGNGTDKYSLCQAEFYQLYAYGQKYMNGKGDMIFYFSKI